MRHFIALACLGTLLACSAPTPYEKVQGLRIKYIIQKLDFTVNDETQEVTYEVELQNLSGSSDLQEVTVLIEAMDDDQNTFWSRTRELDVNGLGDMGTKSFQFKDVVEDATNMVYFNVTVAPVNDDSDYEKYREFRRVVTTN